MRTFLVVVLILSTGLVDAAAAHAQPPPGTPPSAWSAPALTNPQTIELSSANSGDLVLSDDQDYVLACPTGVLVLTSHMQVRGGRNVVFQNCDLEVTSADWAARFESQTGALWIHDVHFGGPQLTGGFQLQEPGATSVVLEDILFDQVHGSQSTNHAECIQTWSGPQQLLIDGLVCGTTYQGLFLLPNQDDGITQETDWDFRNVEINGEGAYDLWLADTEPSVIPSFDVSDVYDCGPGEPRDYDGTADGGAAWSNVQPCPELPTSPVTLTGDPAQPVTGVADAAPPQPLSPLATAPPPPAIAPPPPAIAPAPPAPPAGSAAPGGAAAATPATPAPAARVPVAPVAARHGATGTRRRVTRPRRRPRRSVRARRTGSRRSARRNRAGSSRSGRTGTPAGRRSRARPRRRRRS
jgi:hypothetical protein